MSAAPNPFYVPMPDFKRLCIFGAGGSGREVAWLARQAWGEKVELIFGVDAQRYVTEPVNDVPVVLVTDISDTSETRFVAALGDPRLRRRAVAACESAGMRPATLVHPRVEMSDRVDIGSGTIVCAGTIATINIAIGMHVQINLGCTICHDVAIGDFSTLSPGCHISGNVQIGKGVFIGTGATVINGHPGKPLIIGDEATIAAGACVISPVEPGSLVAGVPAARKR